MSTETQTGRVHQELVLLGYQSLPTYSFEPHDMGRSSGGFVCTAYLSTPSREFEVTGAPAATHKLSKSLAAEALLEVVKTVEPPTQVTVCAPAKPGFLAKSPILLFSPGEAREGRALLRECGLEYIKAAIAFYETYSSPDYVLPEPSALHSAEVSAADSSGESASPWSNSHKSFEPIYPWVDLPHRPTCVCHGAALSSHKLSQCLSRILRHDALRLGIPMNENHFVKSFDLIHHLPCGTTFDDLEDVVYRSRVNGVPRFEMLPDCEVTGRGNGEATLYGSMVRATNKHSILVSDIRNFALVPRTGDGAPITRTKTYDPNRS